ncbi:MAG: polysaccharide deacetylase family protein [Chitinispirillaceae bacterium]|nr:polysaccharide deacetylase family protein [Chitinispirillaceae bacterium]
MHTVSHILSALLFPFFTGAAGVFFFGNPVRRPAVRGLLFHSIYSNQFRPALSSVPAKLFSAIIHRIKSNSFVPITTHDAMNRSADGTAQWQFLLTFDDGCRSFYTRALPVLEALNVKATLFPVAGYLGKTSTWDVLPVFSHLSKSEVREISGLGHEIGSHSMTHPDLAFLNDRDLSEELNGSKKLLEDVTGKKVTSISFPYGSWNKRVWDRAVEAGYRCGSIYRKHRHALPGLFPVFGVYGFDTPEAVLSRLSSNKPLSTSVALAKMVSHFAKGAPVWKFEKKYRIGRNT